MGIAGTAMNEGRTAGLAFALGICAGSAAWGIAAALGLSAIMLANVWVFEVIRYIGVAYLGWLAFKALRRALSSDEVALGKPVTGSLPTIFAKGAAIHLTNPKAILSWGSIYAIVAPNDASLAMLLGYFAMLYAGSLMIFIGPERFGEFLAGFRAIDEHFALHPHDVVDNAELDGDAAKPVPPGKRGFELAAPTRKL